MATGSLQIFIEDGVTGVITYQLIDAEAGEVWVRTRPIDLQDPKSKKHLKRLLHDIEGEFFCTDFTERGDGMIVAWTVK